MRGLALAALILPLAAGPAVAQAMPGMDMPAHQQMQHAPAATPAPAPGREAEARPAATGTAAAPPDKGAPAPPPPSDHAADAVYGAEAMAGARAQLAREHGGMRLHQILFNLAEVQPGRGRDAYRWDAEGWWGGDVNRLVAKSEGEGRFGRSIDTAEVQALFSRAIGPYHDLQAGIRQDLGSGPRRTYASVGIEGLAPYWFETEGTLFLSTRGDLLARAEAWYDQRLTQRLVAQPRVELNFAAQDVPEQRIGHGLSTAELGLRLRYEVRRELAPYLGLSWERRIGRTGRYARAEGEGERGAVAVLGIRTWF